MITLAVNTLLTFQAERKAVGWKEVWGKWGELETLVVCYSLTCEFLQDDSSLCQRPVLYELLSFVCYALINTLGRRENTSKYSDRHLVRKRSHQISGKTRLASDVSLASSMPTDKFYKVLEKKRLFTIFYTQTIY